MRHYVLPILSYQDPNRGVMAVALVNRKRLLPEKLARFEGDLGFFGGGAEANETPITTIKRELWTDLEGPELSALSQEGIFGKTITSSSGKYTVTPYFLNTWYSQAEYNRLAASCKEGVLDIILDCELEWKTAKWLWPDMPEIINNLFQDYWLYTLQGSKK